MSDRRKGTWDRRATILDRIDEECRPERRMDAEGRKVFEEAAKAVALTVPHNGYTEAREAGLRAMYRALKEPR